MHNIRSVIRFLSPQKGKGLFLAMQIQGIMPWALAFAAGCMIYVVAEEMIPEMTSEGHDHFGVWSFIIGFVIMLALDCIQF